MKHGKRVFEVIIEEFYFAITNENKEITIRVYLYQPVDNLREIIQQDITHKVGKFIEELFPLNPLDAIDNCIDYAIYHGVKNLKPKFIW